MSADQPRPRPRPQPEVDPEPDAATVTPHETDTAPDTAPDTTPEAGREHVGTSGAHRAAEPAPTRRRLRPARLMQAVSVLSVAAGVLVFAIARHDDSSTAAASSAADSPLARLDDPTAAQGYVSAAVTDVVAVTQSDYRRLEDTLQAGLQVTTGAFKTRFVQALTGSGAATRKANRSITSAVVLASGIGATDTKAGSAQVLVFVRLSQSGRNIPGSDRSFVTDLRLTIVKHGLQYLISDLDAGANAGVPSGTTGLRAAAEAARSEVVDSLTFSRAGFSTDLTKAQSGAAGNLAGAIATQAKADLTRMKAGGYDLLGSVSSLAAEQVSDNVAVFLVAARGTRVSSSGTRSSDATYHYAVTVQRLSGDWVATAINPVGSS